jgi:hypothetical protein
MSNCVLPQIALWPVCVNGTSASQQSTSLVENFISHEKQPRWHVDAKGSRGSQVDSKLEFSRLQHRQVGGLRALRILPV